jgi:phage shock protein E
MNGKVILTFTGNIPKAASHSTYSIRYKTCMNSLLFALSVIAILIIYFFIKNPSKSNSILKFIQNGALVIDVRSQQEFDSGHFSTAKNIPHDQIKNRLREIGDDKKRPIILYCASGGRSEAAKNILMEQGFVNVVNAGGYGVMKQFETAR